MTLEPGSHRLTRNQSKIADLSSRAIWCGRCGDSLGRRARLLHHLDQDLPSFRRTRKNATLAQRMPSRVFTSTRNPRRSTAAIVGSLRLDVSKFPGNQDERILVVGVHVLKDLVHCIESARGRWAAVIFGEAVTQPITPKPPTW